MAQSNYTLANKSAPASRAKINDVFQSIVTNNSGSSAPATTFPHQWWYDTTTNILKQRNAANSAWINIGTFNQSTGTFSPSGVAQLTQAQAQNPASTVFGTVSGERLAQASAARIAAVAMGEPGETRIVSRAINPLVQVVDPSGVASVIFTDLPPAPMRFEFETVQPAVTSGRHFLMDLSQNNGATWPRSFTITGAAGDPPEPYNWQSTAGGRLGGLSGVASLGNAYLETRTHAPTNLAAGALLQHRQFSFNVQTAKPRVAINAVRFRWNSVNFRAAANQRIFAFVDFWRQEPFA